MIEVPLITDEKLKSKLAFKKLQRMDTHEIEQHILTAIESHPDAYFDPKTMGTGNFSEDVMETAKLNGWRTVQIPYVDSKDNPGQEAKGINTSKRLHEVLGKLQTELRDAGHTFTQAMGVPRAHQEDHRYHMGKLTVSFRSKNDPLPTVKLSTMSM